MDVAEGLTSVVAVGRQYGAATGGAAAYVFLDGVPGPEGRTGAARMARSLGNMENLRGISALTLEDDTGHKFRHFALVTYGWLARMSEAGSLVWEKEYRAIGPSVWTVSLHAVAWRSDGAIVAGGYFPPGSFLPGFNYGIAALVYSDSKPDERVSPTCSIPANTRQTEIEVRRTPGPMTNDSFAVLVQTWTAAVDANGYVIVYCLRGDPTPR